MSRQPFDAFNELWLVDFEFNAREGERPVPICVVAREYRTGRVRRVWLAGAEPPARAPYPLGEGVLFVGYYASAELGCHLALNWPLPPRILDLFAEFRCMTSGLETACGHGLLGALAHFGVPSLAAAEKSDMRQLAMRGGPYSDNEREALLEYCQSDVDALAGLLPAMSDRIDLPRALLRGRYMAAAARMEWVGTPIDIAVWRPLRDQWGAIKCEVMSRVDQEYDVFDGLTFKRDQFAAYLTRNNIPWPRLESGALALDDETFKTMANRYPQLQPLRELRKTLSALRLHNLAVGSDGRNRCLLSCFGTKTGRNAPSNSRFVYGLPAWCRGLIKPAPGRALAYIDYEQQEFGIAAALSKDPAMMEAYASGDPYLTFAKQAGAAPRDATRESHGHVRDQFKVCALAVLYGMAASSLAGALGQPEAHARELLRLHRETYKVFWRWVESALNHAMLHNYLYTVFGWRIRVGPKSNPRSHMNFPMQGNGAEMLRLACCLLTERGIQVCAPVHDAVLVEGPIDAIDTVVAEAQAAMCEASEVVLSGFKLRTEAKIIRHPDRFRDERGSSMWTTVMGILDELRAAACPSDGQVGVPTGGRLPVPAPAICAI